MIIPRVGGCLHKGQSLIASEGGGRGVNVQSSHIHEHMYACRPGKEWCDLHLLVPERYDLKL